MFFSKSDTQKDAENIRTIQNNAARYSKETVQNYNTVRSNGLTPDQALKFVKNDLKKKRSEFVMKNKSRVTFAQCTLIILLAAAIFIYIMVLRAFNIVSNQGFSAALPHLMIIAIIGTIETILLGALLDFKKSDIFTSYPIAIIIVIICLVWFAGGFGPVSNLLSH